MSKTASISIVINIRVPAGHTIVAENQAAAREKVGKYVADLLAGLGVPGSSQINWEKQAAGTKTVKVVINEKTARLRHTTTHSLDILPADFCTALCEDILRNRALFVTSALIRHVAEKSDPSFRQFEEKNQERMVHTLLAQGFGLQRIEQYIPPKDSEDKSPDAWAEACFGDLESARFVMFAHTSQIEPDDNPTDFNRLIEGADYFVDAAFKVKGVPFPKMRGEKRSDFAPDEIAFQINDLLFPTRKIADVQTENVRFVNFLTGNSAFFLNRGTVLFLLDSLELANPNLLALAKSRFSTDFIAAVLRHLAAEGISIRPLVRILEILISGGQDVFLQEPSTSVAPPLSETIHLTATKKKPEELEVSDWAELVRLNLKNAIINRALPHFDEPFVLNCLFLDVGFLEKIARFDTLSEVEQTDLRETMHRQIGEHYLTAVGKIRPIITSAAWRKKISELIAFEFPDTPVLSLQECLPRVIAKFDKVIG